MGEVFAVVWMFVSPHPNPYVEILTPRVMALKGKAFGKY